jgi:serine protease Do
MIRNKLYIRLIAALIFFFVIGVSINGRGLLAERASAQEKLESNEGFSLPLAVVQEQSALARTPSSYSGYTRITDNEEKIMVQVPVEWSDIETGAWTFKGKNVGVFVAASADLGSFYSTGSQSGVLIGVSRSLAQTYNQSGLLGVEKRDLSRQCLHKGRFDYKNQFYSGQYDQFANCASGTPGLFIFTTSSADQKSLIMIRIAVVSEADLEAVDTIINTFQVLGNPERDDHHDG